MRALFYDTETTGLPLWNLPSSDARQPHIVQLAALLVDLDMRRVLSSIDLTIAPTAWEIPDDVIAVHGITNEHAHAIGVEECDALGILGELWSAATVRIAHNESFDARIVRIATLRYHGNGFGPEPERWKAGVAECTQALSTPILNLPPTEKMLAARRTGPKPANLREAFRHFMGRELEDAHSAAADARGCMEVYFAIKGAKV